MLSGDDNRFGSPDALFKGISLMYPLVFAFSIVSFCFKRTYATQGTFTSSQNARFPNFAMTMLNRVSWSTRP